MKAAVDGRLRRLATATTLWLALIAAPDGRTQSTPPAEEAPSVAPRRLHPTAPPPELAPKLTIHRDVVYGDKDSVSQRLDAYLSASPPPTIRR